MSVAALFSFRLEETRTRPVTAPVPKADWPLMCDVATCRAGVPEALILWRRARGEDPPTIHDT